MLASFFIALCSLGLVLTIQARLAAREQRRHQDHTGRGTTAWR
ncbi:hypothetical protein [Sedimentitalea nanhaiensis]|uniref:Uncharacterized protein n=1 Tax=Sedimentitalea nanhaiensis TaxID=999627 RepID=A0A1I7CES2_9RHOB|nr:hypothetical protein [Sedimentitalea nanhaiensis]SFT97891.1 hypothetical protein SAMN05216236_11642 [Sedimentitalea nanhaiensis]